jgi:hypothetical protein
VNIENNGSLTDIDRLSGLGSIYRLLIVNNGALTGFDLSAAGEVGLVNIQNNDALSGFTLPAANRQVDYLRIVDNDALRDLGGLEKVEVVGDLLIR